MRKTVTVFWSVLLAMALTVQPVHAEAPTTDGEREESALLLSDDSEVSAEGEESPVPDDIWDGAYTEFKGPDGQVTTVFDNGSVVTEYRDGSAEGVNWRVEYKKRKRRTLRNPYCPLRARKWLEMGLFQR